MSASEMASTLLKSIEAGEMAAAAKLLSDGFMFSGPVPQPIGGSEWLGMHEKLHAAFPDFRFNLSDLHEHGSQIHGTVQISGTNKGSLDLSSIGMPTIPATGKSIKLPKEELTFTSENGKLASLSVAPVAGGGVMGILGQLGVKVPAL